MEAVGFEAQQFKREIGRRTRIKFETDSLPSTTQGLQPGRQIQKHLRDRREEHTQSAAGF
jgi:hypothetical protein